MKCSGGGSRGRHPVGALAKGERHHDGTLVGRVIGRHLRVLLSTADAREAELPDLTDEVQGGLRAGILEIASVG